MAHIRGIALSGLLVVIGGAMPSPASAAGQGARGVAAGLKHSCAVTSGGGVKCWGFNNYGQLGDGTTATRGTPAGVSGLAAGVVAVAAGDVYTCALTDAGALLCWGDNSFGNLGDGTTTSRATPVSVLGLSTGVAAVAAGSHHTCAVTTGGGLKCWGHNYFGQLGDSTTVSRLLPADVVGLPGGVVALAAGANHTCAITSGGGVMCWGDNSAGQLGDGSTTTRLTPVNVSGLSSGTVALACGSRHTCAVSDGGAVTCWGGNSRGQLGDGTTLDHLTPVATGELTSGAVAVAAGTVHTCAVGHGGSLTCWGGNYFGQLGDGTAADRHSPIAVRQHPDGVVSLAAGDLHTCAATSDGGVHCWGLNDRGQIGDGYDGLSPLDVGVEAIAVATGETSTCAVTTAGGVQCWGYNGYGQLGDGTTVSRYMPADVTGLTSGVVAVAVGSRHACALTSAGGVKCWGSNGSGQVGDGTRTERDSPVDVSGLTSGVVAISTREDHTCALTSAGEVKCWGLNSWGQLGDGTTSTRLTPVGVMGLTSGIVSVVAGSQHTCAVTSGGGVRCWGWNGRGQLGNDRPYSSSTPVDVSELSSGVLALAAGAVHTCAVVSGGGMKCWGGNAGGELGDGTTTGRYVPVDVVGLAGGAVAVAAGGGHTCAITSGGGLTCWGSNASGQLGDGTEERRLTPVGVKGLTGGVVAVAGDSFNTCAVTRDAALKCWGYSSHLLGDATARLTPTEVVMLGWGLVFSEPPHGDPNPADSNTPVALATTAVASSGAGVSYVWSSDCADAAGNPEHGRFVPSAYVRSPHWWLPANLAPTRRVCTIGVTATAVDGAWNTFSYRQAVKPARPIDQDDLIWQSDDGWLAAWIMSGTTQVATTFLWGEPVAIDGWRVVAVADLDGDGQKDLIWQHSDGWVAAWFMGGQAQARTALLSDYPAAAGGWSIAASGDLTGDGRADVIWQHADGYIAMWAMDGATQLYSVLLDTRPVAAGGWVVAATGDLDGDGQVDLVWQSPTGLVAAWLMNGSSQISNTLLCQVPAATDGWTIVGTAEMNGDGMIDLLWQQRPLGPTDTSRGLVATWFMNGTSVLDSSWLAPSRVSDPRWKIVGPK